MREKSREERFDDVFQIVLIVVALSFDILWISKVPIAEILVFIFALVIWAYGNLKGSKTEYPFKIGSFNLLIILLTNFYSSAAFTYLEGLDIWLVIISAIVLPLLCLVISYSLARYLKDALDKEITRGILFGGTLGYMISMTLALTLGA
jgi:hypothetical protein